MHFLQIWLEPNRLGVEPAYDQQHFPLEERRGHFVLLVSPHGHAGSIATHQDSLLYGTPLKTGDALEHRLEPGRRAYIQAARGRAEVNDQVLNQGDGLAVEGVEILHFQGIDTAELLLFDLP